MNVPSGRGQNNLIAPVSLRISFELCFPEVPSCGWHDPSVGAIMAVPKTPMDKNYGFMFRQNYIGAPGQFNMKSES